ncbi:MAG: phosphodiester glycosidase family protein [Thermoguttaceae bacterium]|nr:phosphodiester glycosidase family protein [Thermoguttaceae bacterium]MDW8077396.1 phosphodiester glycosidase family protein [Thermoguttaceae bacterium]
MPANPDLRFLLSLSVFLSASSALINTYTALAEDRLIPAHPAIKVQVEVRYHPRLIRVFSFLVPTDHPDLKWDVAIAPDNDGPGPSEASLVDPVVLARRAGLLVAIHADAWAVSPREDRKGGDKREEKLEAFRSPIVDICGWVCREGKTISKPDPAHWSFWFTPSGEPRIGNLREEVPAQLAISGFGPLVLEGKILPGEGGELAPRCAVGVTRDRRTGILMVVDGRRRGWSEGVNCRELAELLRDKGAWEAIQLDGGGSAFAIVRDATGEYRIINRPSDSLLTRPIPALVGVRRSK